MLKLNELSPQKGSKKSKKRVGRGIGSGLGKTCGRGHKGQSSRSGGTKGVRFEGGQTPIYRRLPKRGFCNYPFRKEYRVINVADLADAGDAFEFNGKVLGNGELKKAVTVKALKFSRTAKQKIEAAGGKCIT